MPTSVFDQLRQVLLPEAGDAELLGAFVERRDEASLAVLVKRHGPMVWGVCRRRLNHHDAEDAFQATFIVLVRKAASIASRETVGNWLYGVAYQTALQASRTAARRRAREVPMTEMPDAEAIPLDQWPLLDQELNRLPDNYRAVLVLCDLEDRTRKEAARQLGVPEGTVAGRLARARALLAKRLAQRGITLSGGALAAILSRNGASAAVPASVLSSTITVAWGRAALSAKVAALADGVLKAMLMTKLKAVLAVALILGCLATGTAFVASRTAAGDDLAPDKPVHRAAAPAPAKPAAPAPETTATAWGDVVEGLQAGVYIRNKHDIAIGGKAMFLLRLRNVSNKTITVSAWPTWVIGAVVVDASGKRAALFSSPPPPGAVINPIKITLSPGQMVAMDEDFLHIVDADAKGPIPLPSADGAMLLLRPGKHKVRFKSLLQEHPMATGTAEFEVKTVGEGFTAWGKEIAGLQAGLNIGTDRHRHGETVTFRLRVRNVGKEEVKFSYLQPFVEHALVVTDSKGKAIPQPNIVADIGERDAGVTKLESGEEIELCEMKRRLTPAGENVGDKDRQPHALHATGTVGVRYEHVPGPPEMGLPNWKLDAALSKLATGTLELNVAERKSTAVEGDNPYRNCELGDWIEFKVIAPKTPPAGILRRTVTSKTDRELRCERVATYTENGRSETLKAEAETIDLTKPYDEFFGGVMRSKGFEVELVEQGKSAVVIGAKKYEAKWRRMKVVDPTSKERSVQTIWHSDEVPFGGILKVEKTGADGSVFALEYLASGSGPKLTGNLAKTLLPAAAGIRNLDLQKLLANRTADAVKSKSLSLVIFALRPTKAPNAAMEKEFRFLGGTVNVADVTKAIWLSKDAGYASFLQPQYITECTCESTAERAEGVVAFKSDLFAGRIPFVAEATRDGWVITEFRLAQYQTRVVRGEDGVWSQKALNEK